MKYQSFKIKISIFIDSTFLRTHFIGNHNWKGFQNACFTPKGSSILQENQENSI